MQVTKQKFTQITSARVRRWRHTATDARDRRQLKARDDQARLAAGAHVNKYRRCEYF